MRILILGINYAPELTGTGKYTAEMAEWLAGRGHAVRVVTAPPYYPMWKVADGYSGWRYRRENRAGVGVWRCPLWVPRKVTGIKRLIHLASFAASSTLPMLAQWTWRPDVVAVIEPPFLCAPLALVVARLSGATSWLHVQDFEVDAAFALGILQSRHAQRWVLQLERALLRRFDLLSTISEPMRQRLGNKRGSAPEAHEFGNWVDTDTIFPLRQASLFRAELGIPPDAIVCLYSGNMGEKQGLEILAEAARAHRATPNLHFLFCGDGAARGRLEQATHTLDNVRFLPLQPMQRLNHLLNTADIHLLPQRADVGDLVMPSKLTGMLASGRPVVATAAAGTQVSDIVGRCGIVTAPGDAEAFSNAINTLANAPQLRAELGIAARSYTLAHFSRDTILMKLEQTLLDTSAEARDSPAK